MNHRKTKGRPRAFDKDNALEKAMNLFWRHGYDGTSLGQLTEEIGIAAPSLYSAFGSKEDLFRLAIERYFQTVSSQASEELSTAKTAFEGLENVLYASAISFSDPNSPFGCMIGIGALRCSSSNQKVQKATARLRQRSYETLRSRLIRAQTGNEIDQSANVDAIADFYSGVVYGMSVLASDGASCDRLTALAKMAMAAWPKKLN